MGSKDSKCEKCGRIWFYNIDEFSLCSQVYVRRFEKCMCRRNAIHTRIMKPKIKLIDRRGTWRENEEIYRTILSYNDFKFIDSFLKPNVWRRARQCWRINRQ